MKVIKVKLKWWQNKIEDIIIKVEINQKDLINRHKYFKIKLNYNLDKIKNNLINLNNTIILIKLNNNNKINLIIIILTIYKNKQLHLYIIKLSKIRILIKIVISNKLMKKLNNKI